jgi:pimeloyl-ACP methyl ester carboxylesterase
VAERFYGRMDDHDFADFVRVCFPLLSSYAMTSEVIARANWTPEVLMRWMAGEAKALDLRPELPGIGTPVLVLAGEDDAWAPLESAREVADLLPDARFRSFVRGRHSIFRDAPESYEELRLFLDEVRAGEGMA